MIAFESSLENFELTRQESVSDWLLSLVKSHGQSVQEITYVFLSDEELLKINRTHLNHDYYTDIITFPLHDEGAPILSDIFISLDRVKDNAGAYGVSFEDELHRVMAHGLLHLLGYDDHSDEDVARMREAENHSLAKRNWISD